LQKLRLLNRSPPLMLMEPPRSNPSDDTGRSPSRHLPRSPRHVVILRAQDS